MILHAGDELFPVEGNSRLFRDSPTVRASVFERFSEERRIVHQLFGDAPDVDARATETPGCTLPRGLDEVKNL